MNLLFLYLIKSSFSLIILYLAYNLFFRKEAYYNFSRFMLLLSTLLIIFLPLVSYNLEFILSTTHFAVLESAEFSLLASFSFDEIIIRANPISNNLLGSISVELLFLIIYFMGVGFKSMLFIYRISQIRILIKKSTTFKEGDFNFALTQKGAPSFSFLNWIFINSELYKNDSEVKTIVEHEKIHAKQGHTYDLLFAELLTIIHWFNPFAYFLKKAIKENHEYITDNELIAKLNDKNSYQLLLLKYSNTIHSNILTHNFSYSLLKRRLKIMKKQKNNLGFSLRITALTALFALIFIACSNSDKKPAQTAEEIVVTAYKPDKTAATLNEDTVFTVVDVMPQFVGGEKAMINFIARNISYPTDAKLAGTQGKVFVDFIIETDGKVSSVKINRGIGNGCDEEAMRVVQNMPNWTPGEQGGKAVRVSFTLPIKFALQ